MFQNYKILLSKCCVGIFHDWACDRMPLLHDSPLPSRQIRVRPAIGDGTMGAICWEEEIRLIHVGSTVILEAYEYQEDIDAGLDGARGSKVKKIAIGTGETHLIYTESDDKWASTTMTSMICR